LFCGRNEALAFLIDNSDSVDRSWVVVCRFFRIVSSTLLYSYPYFVCWAIWCDSRYLCPFFNLATFLFTHCIL